MAGKGVVIVTLQAACGAPSLKQSVYKLSADQTVAFVKSWVATKALKTTQNVFISMTVGKSIGFSPTPEQNIGDLATLAAGPDGADSSDTQKLTLFYSFKQTWG
eukprot:TRINITY_DN31198_c0_g1_i1.p3 TRINITY_DN31198_c0_g1~~TRINITY_DN31198_c0_g1_i1.p3  ORF type:complete len:104 (+),score=36.57 TRINITY_DN31198_c0_g1_i1:85-396(+)